MTLLDFEIQCNPIFQILRQQFPSLQLLTTFLSSFLSSKTSSKFPLWNVFHSNTPTSPSPYQIICIAPLAQEAELNLQSLLYHHFSAENSNEINHYFNQIDNPVSFEGLVKDEDGNYSFTNEQVEICISFLLTHLFVVQESSQIGINLNTKHIIHLRSEKLVQILPITDLFFETQASVINWSVQDWEKNWQTMSAFFQSSQVTDEKSLLRNGTIDLMPKQWKPLHFYIISESLQFMNCFWNISSAIPIKEVLKSTQPTTTTTKPISAATTITAATSTSVLSKSLTNTFTSLGNLFARRQVSSATTTPTPSKEIASSSTESLVESKLNDLIQQHTQPIQNSTDLQQQQQHNSTLFQHSSEVVETVEQMASNSASKKYSFQDFMEKIKHKSAAALVKKIRAFIDQTNSSSFVITEQFPQQVHQFISEILENVQVHPLWKSASELELDNTRESIEKYLTTKMYGKIFASSVEDIREDEELHKKLTQLRSVKPEQFEIAMEWILHPNWAVALEELRKINQYKAPRDKMICLSNSCKLLFKLSENDKNDLNTAMNADVFLPLLIYLVLKANPPHLHSNFKFILDYRNPDKIVSEAAYFLTNIEGAITFWKNATASQLNMEQRDFERVLSGKLFQEDEEEQPISEEKDKIVQTEEEDDKNSSLLQLPDEHQQQPSSTMLKIQSTGALVQTPRSVNSSPIHVTQEDIAKAENQVKKQHVEVKHILLPKEDTIPQIVTTQSTPRNKEDAGLLENRIKEITRNMKLSNKFSSETNYMELQMSEIPSLLEDYKQLYQLFLLCKKNL